MSNLPPNPYDRTVIVDTAVDNPDRAPLAGNGRDIVVSLTDPSVVGRDLMFLSSSGKWVPFTTTDFSSWGAIVGDITDQADLMAMFAEYSKTTEFHSVAFSGNYNQLNNKPPLGTVAPINLDGLTSHFLRGDGTWAVPVDVFAVWGNIQGTLSNQADLQASLNAKANLASPVFIGTPQAPTPPVDDNSTRLATTAWFFGQAFNGVPVMDGAASSGASLRWARGDHVHPSDTSRAPVNSPALTGIPLSTTPTFPDNSTRIATTAYVTAAIAASGGVSPPPSDGNIYGYQNGAWVALSFATKWDRT